MELSQVEEAAKQLVLKNNLEDIHEGLVRFGVNPIEASKILLFLPSAFAKEFFEPQGIEFPTKFSTRSSDGKSLIEHDYSDEPLYSLACQVAQSWIKTGNKNLVLRILDWSVESKLIKQAKDQGLTPARMSQIIHEF